MTQDSFSPVRGWAIVVVLALAAMVSSLQFTLTVPVLPEIPSILDVSIGDAAWLIIATLLSSTVSTPIVSRLADLYGRRRLLLISLGMLVAGSFIAAIGMTFVTVIIGRVLQGFAVAVVPIGVSLIHSHVNPRQANMGVAMLSGTIGMGSSLGLPLSGVVMHSMGLSGIFWISGVAGVLFLLGVWIIVPEATDRLHKKLDPWSTIFLLAWLTSLMLLISKGAEWGWLSPWAFGNLAVVLVALPTWLRRSLLNPNAVIDVRLAGERMMLRINLASFLATFGMFMNHLITIQEARAPVSSGIGLGLPVSTAGLVLLPFAITMIILTPVTGWSINSFGARMTLTLGVLIMAAGYTFRIFWHQDLTSILIGTIVVGAGTSFAFAAMPALVSQASPTSELASANGVNSLVRSFSGTLASSVYALILVVFPSAVDPQYFSRTGLIVTFSTVAIGCVLAASVAFHVKPRGPHLS